jgi:hypothetical protein
MPSAKLGGFSWRMIFCLPEHVISPHNFDRYGGNAMYGWWGNFRINLIRWPKMFFSAVYFKNTHIKNG